MTIKRQPAGTEIARDHALPADRSAPRVAALQRGIDVLECFLPSNQPLSHTELSRMTRLPKATVTRLVNTLVHAGLLRQDSQTEKYQLGPRLPSLANAYMSSFDVRTFARPVMERLARETDLSVTLAIPTDLDMLIIEVCRPPTSALITRVDIGSRVPMSISAVGRAYLAAVDQRTCESLLHRMEATHGEHWTTIRRHLDESLRQSRRMGYCHSMGELYPDVNSIAAALRMANGDVIALTCGGPSTVLTRSRIEDKIGPKLLDAIDELVQAMGT